MNHRHHSWPLPFRWFAPACVPGMPKVAVPQMWKKMDQSECWGRRRCMEMKMIENASAIQTTDLPSICERQPLRVLALLIHCLHYFLGRLTKIVLQSVQPWRFCGSGPWQSKTTRKARHQRSMKDNWALTSHSLWKLGPFWHIATVGS